MAKLYDWVKQSVSSAPGTGAITLGSELETYITFAEAGVIDGETVYYTVVDGKNRERGIGTYSTTGPTLTRTWIQAKLESGVYSANPATGLDLSVNAVVGCSPVSATHNFRGCLLYHSVTQSIPSGVPATILAYDSEVYDTDGFHDNAVNNSRITIPNNLGISLVRLSANINYSPNSAGVRHMNFLKNGESFPGQGGCTTSNTTAGEPTRFNLMSGIVPCADGDYFELFTFQTSGTTLTVGAASHIHWFALEVIE